MPRGVAVRYRFLQGSQTFLVGIQKERLEKPELIKTKEQIETINNFKNNKFNILVASSVGEEGIDIPEVNAVIFYETIGSELRKIQRGGRTGRTKPSYDELAKFWVEAQHTDYNYTIANCYSVTDLVLKQQKHLQILVDEFESLDQDFFEELFKFTNDSGKVERFFYEPFPFQKQICPNIWNRV